MVNDKEHILLYQFLTGLIKRYDNYADIKAFADDAEGFVKFFQSVKDETYGEAVRNLGHDFNGIINQDLLMLPKCTGYAKSYKEFVMAKVVDSYKE